jgi:hypothetical protein
MLGQVAFGVALPGVNPLAVLPETLPPEVVTYILYEPLVEKMVPGEVLPRASLIVLYTGTLLFLEVTLSFLL